MKYLNPLNSHVQNLKQRFFREIGGDCGLQPGLLKGEIEHSVFFNISNFADLGLIWEPYLQLDVLSFAFIYARHTMEMQNMSGFAFEDILTEVSLGWKCFGTYGKSRHFYIFDEKYVRLFKRKSIKGERVAALNKILESNQCDEILDTIKIF